MITSTWNCLMLANSMWMRCMGWLAHSQVRRGATGGKLLWAAQLLQLVTTSYSYVFIHVRLPYYIYFMLNSFSQSLDVIHIIHSTSELAIRVGLSLLVPTTNSLGQLQVDSKASVLLLLLCVATPPLCTGTQLLVCYLSLFP